MTSVDEKPKTPLLDTIGDVEREMAAVYRDLRAKRIGDDEKLLSVKHANALILALNIIRASKSDHRDALWTRRAKKLWKKYGEGIEPPPAVQISNH